MKKILIAIPTAKYIESETFKSIYDLDVPDGYETTFQYFYGYRVDQVRNLIADWVIKGYDYLFSVDHDVILPKDALTKLLSHDKDLCAGVYRQRLEPQTLEIYDMSYRNIHDVNGDLIQIGACGFGCTLVKKEVFTAIEYPHFEYHPALDHKNTFSEDLDFCKKANNLGFSLFADTSVLCGHIGQKNFEVYTGPHIEKPFRESEDILELDSNSVENRLRELSEQRLLPSRHVQFLEKIKNEGFEPKVIYDIGACVLHWTNEAKRIWPNAHFYAFEAMDETEFLYKEAGIGYHLGVLSDKDGKIVEFNQNLEHPGGNSYFTENPELSPLATELWTDENKVQKVAMTLDTIIERNSFNNAWEYPDLIKMDVQGAELDILYGSKEVLKNCNHLILELQHKDYNIGAPKAKEVIEYVESLGFTNHGMFCGSNLCVDGDYYFTRKKI